MLASFRQAKEVHRKNDILTEVSALLSCIWVDLCGDFRMEETGESFNHQQNTTTTGHSTMTTIDTENRPSLMLRLMSKKKTQKKNGPIHHHYITNRFHHRQKKLKDNSDGLTYPNIDQWSLSQYWAERFWLNLKWKMFLAAAQRHALTLLWLVLVVVLVVVVLVLVQTFAFFDIRTSFIGIWWLGWS